ncbi:hypothetical protein NW754_014567 [Fusarium falciforme]|nr:hypothetical protein NW754_014567 [Fusarium falciforme]KAJ4236836.1 hypothetical protein NW757_013335 [Fusarium falciforme]
MVLSIVISQIAQFRVERLDAFAWALRDYKFLIYDDTSDNGDNDMSYCWPVPQQDDDGKDIQEERHYQVRDLDGTPRKSHALDDIIDRTADVANSLGLRMIWIDQECLPQPDERSPQDEKDEQQIRVQSMDILYSRAMTAGGLHSLELSNQSQVNAISSAMQPDYSAGRCDDFHHVIDFFDRVSQERWYQRAWVAQEMLSAGSRLFLVFRRAAGISYPSRFRLDHSRLRSTRHSLDSAERGLESRVLRIQVTEFQQIVKSAQQVIQRRSCWLAVGVSRQYPAAAERNEIVLDKTGQLFPPVMIGRSLPTKASLFHTSGFQNTQYRIDAVGALTLLKIRGCRDVRDRIAIMKCIGFR